MTRRKLLPLYWGVGLFLVGLFFTMFVFGPLATYEQEILWGVVGLLGVGGLLALAYGVIRPERWWYFVPAFLLLSMAAIVYMGVSQEIEGRLLTGVLLIGMGLAHLLIFLTDRENRWWAWISAGSFFVLSAAVLLGTNLPPALVGSLLFLGMSLVFYLLYLFTPAAFRRWWMLTLAVTLTIAAAFTFTLSGDVRASPARFWPLLLILVGLALIAWALVQLLTRETPSGPAYVSPPQPEPPSVPPSTDVIPVPEEMPEPASVSPKPEPPSPPEGAEEAERDE